MVTASVCRVRHSGLCPRIRSHQGTGSDQFNRLHTEGISHANKNNRKHAIG